MKLIVIKIGGSILGNHDTTVESLAQLQKQRGCLPHPNGIEAV